MHPLFYHKNTSTFFDAEVLLRHSRMGLLCCFEDPERFAKFVGIPGGTVHSEAEPFAGGSAALMLFSGFGWARCLLYALIAAPLAAATELYSHNGHDTVTVAAAVAAVLLILPRA